MTFQESFEKMRSLEQDLTFLSAKTEFDESNIPFKEKLLFCKWVVNTNVSNFVNNI